MCHEKPRGQKVLKTIPSVTNHRPVVQAGMLRDYPRANVNQLVPKSIAREASLAPAAVVPRDDAEIRLPAGAEMSVL